MVAPGEPNHNLSLDLKDALNHMSKKYWKKEIIQTQVRAATQDYFLLAFDHLICKMCKNVHHNFPRPRVRSSNSFFYPTNSLKLKDFSRS